MAKKSEPKIEPTGGLEPVPNVGEDGGATTQGGGGYWSGQGVDPKGDAASTDGTGTGSSE